MKLAPITADQVVLTLPLAAEFVSAAALGRFNAAKFRAKWEQIIAAGLGFAVGVWADDGGLVGGAGAYVTEDHHTGEIVATEAYYYITPAARGHGLALMRALEDEARARGAKSLFMVHLAGEKAESISAYYKRRGFVLKEFLYQKAL